LLPPSLIPHGKFASNANIIAPDSDSGLNVAVAASESPIKVDHDPPAPSSPLTTTEEIIHTGTGMLTTSEPSPHSAPMDSGRTTTANPGMRVGQSDGELDGQRLPVGVLFSEEMPTDFSHSKSRYSLEPVPSTLTLAVCESTQNNQSSEGGHQALTPRSPLTPSSETVNAAPDISMASNLDIGPNPVEMIFKKSSEPSQADITSMELITSGKGNLKRKMIDRGCDSDAHASDDSDEGFKRNRIMTVAEEDSDIVYIGSWIPGKTVNRTKNIIQTAVKVENLPIKLVSDSNVPVSAKPD
jgi:hypothetical protein